MCFNIVACGLLGLFNGICGEQQFYLEIHVA